MVCNKCDCWKISNWIRIGAGCVLLQTRNEFSSYLNMRSLTPFKNSILTISGSIKTRLSDWLVLNIGELRLLESQKLMSQRKSLTSQEAWLYINPLNDELNPICHLLALLGVYFLHVSRIRVKSLTLRLLMSYIYGAPILDVSRSHTTTQHSR